MHFKHKIVLIMDFLEECCFFLTFFRFSQNNPFTEKRQKCKKKTLLQKCHNQYNFMLKIHLRGTSRLSMFYFFDLWPDFLTELLSFRNFHQILAKKCILSCIFGHFWPFFKHRPSFSSIPVSSTP